jgi:hypothetical protein
VLQRGLVPARKSTKAVGTAPNAQLPSAGGIKPAAPGLALPTIAVPPVVAPTLTVPAHLKVPPIPDPSRPHGLLGA